MSIVCCFNLENLFQLSNAGNGNNDGIGGTASSSGGVGGGGGGGSGWFNRCDQCCCACCCSPFKPRYKRLVDTIFPSNAEDGLVKSNMEKLIFYAMSSPDKLDKIGAYLAERIGRDLYRHRFGFVLIAVEAMDQLLKTCHNSLHLFMESFLKVVQLVLESQDPELQILATQSFVKFAKIEEDTPAYHRSYDFFVSKFASLCHDNHPNLVTRRRLRMAGLIGIKGLILKAVSDDMQVNIWADNNMGKIIPSLLFNMKSKDFEDDSKLKDSQTRLLLPGAVRFTENDLESSMPNDVATECLRELINRASFGHLHNILKPIITHFDLHRFWEMAADQTGDNFAIETFKIIMYSIQSKPAVIQILMNHLDCVAKGRRELENCASENKIKVQTGIVNVLNEIIAIPADTIGPFVLGMINSLLQHLHDSINNIQTQFVEEEKQFQEAVINTLGEFTTNLPDYQKIETMIFIIDKAPPALCTSATEQQLQNIILKSLLKVTTKYKPVSMIQTFPSTLLNQLLTRALSPDPKTRLTVQKIFHQLLDRHKNLPRLIKPVTVVPPETLTIEKADRYDINFMRKHGHDILVHIYRNIQIESNTKENFDSIFTTMSLICVEMNSDEVLIDLLRLTFALQDMAISRNFNLSDSHRCYIHSIVAGFLHLFSHLKAIPAICTHVEQVIKTRVDQAKYLLPEYCHLANNYTCGELFISENGHNQRENNNKSKENSPSRQNSADNLVADELLFNKQVISEALQTTGHDTLALNTPFQSNCDVDSSITRSTSDLNAITVEIDSVNSSPGTVRKVPEQEINFNTFKEVLINPNRDHKQDLRRRMNLLNNFKNSKFEDLVENYPKSKKSLQEILLDTIDKSFQAQETKVHQNQMIQNPSKHSLDTLDHHDQDIISIVNHRSIEGNCHVYDNPLLSLCDISQINSRAPPLFALRFPNLFVY
ncbi:protein EFR3 homolog stmA isoform X1 [Dermatophagoides farinae]|uniref:protein EFR3 homolog stmA isoform X1 n=1 Tax=Dermatophagoides farinae TaxID=6954 RepID=UPI001F0F5FBE|nr:protein EFR3 homolog B-like isoform X1 [Dermatophagoides farinae]